MKIAATAYWRGHKSTVLLLAPIIVVAFGLCCDRRSDTGSAERTASTSQKDSSTLVKVTIYWRGVDTGYKGETTSEK